MAATIDCRDTYLGSIVSKEPGLGRLVVVCEQCDCNNSPPEIELRPCSRRTHFHSSSVAEESNL